MHVIKKLTTDIIVTFKVLINKSKKNTSLYHFKKIPKPTPTSNSSAQKDKNWKQNDNPNRPHWFKLHLALLSSQHDVPSCLRLDHLIHHRHSPHHLHHLLHSQFHLHLRFGGSQNLLLLHPLNSPGHMGDLKERDEY